MGILFGVKRERDKGEEEMRDERGVQEEEEEGEEEEKGGNGIEVIIG